MYEHEPSWQHPLGGWKEIPALNFEDFEVSEGSNMFWSE